MAIRGFLSWYCQGNHDDDPLYGGEDSPMTKFKDEYTNNRKRRENSFVLYTDIMVATFVALVIGLLLLLNSGNLDPKPRELVEGYFKPIANPVNKNETYHLTLNLKSNTLSAQNPIFASAKLEMIPTYIGYNTTTGEPFDRETMKPMPKYIRILFNGTSCNLPTNEYDRVFPCWMDLQINDNGFYNITYTNHKTVYYLHQGGFDITLAYPYNDSPDRSSVQEEFIQISPIEATIATLESRQGYEQWKVVVIIAGIAGLIGGIQLYLRMHWWMKNG